MGVSEAHPRMGDSLKPPIEALHSCVHEGNLSRLRELLASPSHQDLNYQDGHWGTPLHVATWCGNLAAADALLEAGADPLVPLNDDRGLSPLTLAALEGRRDILQRFWGHVSPESETHANAAHVWGLCFIHAAMYGQVSILAEMMDWWDGWPDDVKETALLYAAGRWQVHVVDLLLSRCDEIHFKTLEQALYKAAGFKFPLYEEEQSGVRYEAVDYLNQQQLIALLMEHQADPNTLWHKQHLTLLTSSSINLCGALKAVLEAGADPNAANESGQSALHLLASPIQISDQDTTCRFHETGIRLLLKHNAAVYRRDEAGEAPIHWAAFGSNLHIFRLYLSASRMEPLAVVELKNHHEETLLHFAAAGGKTGIMELLISYGMNVNDRSLNGWTPLMCALARTKQSSSIHDARVKSLSEAVRAARLLLSHGADPAVTTDEGWNPLHLLAVYRDDDEGSEAAELAKELISGGADTGARAPLLVQSPVESSAKGASLCGSWGYRQRDAMEKQASQKSKIKSVYTSLQWATENGALGVARTLLDHGSAGTSSENQEQPPPAYTAVELEAPLTKEPAELE